MFTNLDLFVAVLLFCLSDTLTGLCYFQTAITPIDMFPFVSVETQSFKLVSSENSFQSKYVAIDLLGFDRHVLVLVGASYESSEWKRTKRGIR